MVYKYTAMQNGTKLGKYLWLWVLLSAGDSKFGALSHRIFLSMPYNFIIVSSRVILPNGCWEPYSLCSWKLLTSRQCLILSHVSCWIVREFDRYLSPS